MIPPKHAKIKRLYRNQKWQEFGETVKTRDGWKCTKCNRGREDVILQVHHIRYKPGRLPWEYISSDCITLCKGCHAREHGLIEPSTGWVLISIDDLGDLNGICEREGCGKDIRYEHLTYHPNWGYKVVGSTCIDYLTEIDQSISDSMLKLYQRISNRADTSFMLEGLTGKGHKYLYLKYRHHQIRIYGEKGALAYQLAIKRQGVKWFDFKTIIKQKNKTLEEVLELGLINLMGILSNSEIEKEKLRSMYRLLK